MRGAAVPVSVSLTWPPPAGVRWARLITAPADLALVGIVDPTRRPVMARGPATERLELPWAQGRTGPVSARSTLAVVTGVSVLAAATTTVAGTVVVAVLAALGCRVRLGVAALVSATLASLGGAFALVVIGQRRNRWPADFDWPTHFLAAQRLAMVGVVLVGTTVLVQFVRDRASAGSVDQAGGAGPDPSRW